AASAAKTLASCTRRCGRRQARSTPVSHAVPVPHHCKLPKGVMSTQLTDLSYGVMNLIGRDGAGPHDLVQMARRGQRLYWAGAESKIYQQPKRLEKLGYLTSEKTPGKTRERTHYRLTDKGIRAVQELLALPSHFPRIQNEAAIRVHASDLAEDPSVILQSLKPLR